MRPLKLVLKGFKPFREKQEIDFSNLSFFVVRGPTGSGKSSLLDAILFALYGDKDELGTIDDLINKNSKGFYLDFTFSVKGEVYRIVRSKERNKPVSVRAYKGNTPIVKSSSELNKLIKELLGVDKKIFKQLFLLPQGRYAQFFNETPAKKRETLMELLNLEIYQKLKEKISEDYR